MKLRTSSPAPTASTSAAATSITTRAPRTPRLELVRPSRSALTAAGRESCIAGIRPAMMAATIVTPLAMTAARASIGMRSTSAMSIGRSRSDHVQGPAGEGQSEDSARRGEQEAFDQHLTNQPGAARAQRLTNGKLAAARSAAREQEVGHIRAGDDQENRGRTEDERQHVAQAADEMRAKRHHVRADCGVRLWILARQLRRQRVEFRLRLVDRDVGPKPADDVPECLGPQRCLDIFEALFRHPDEGLRPPATIVEEAQLEAWRHHPDDRIGIAGIETHGAADD